MPITCRSGVRGNLTGVVLGAVAGHLVPLALLVRLHAVLLVPGGAGRRRLVGFPRRERCRPGDVGREVGRAVGEGCVIGELVGAFGVAASKISDSVLKDAA